MDEAGLEVALRSMSLPLHGNVEELKSRLADAERFKASPPSPLWKYAMYVGGIGNIIVLSGVGVYSYVLPALQ